MEIVTESPATIMPSPSIAEEMEEAVGEESSLAATSRWQLINLPWMRAIIVLLALFFFSATVYQLYTIQRFITDLPPIEAGMIFDESEWVEQLPAEQRFEIEKLRILGTMEGHVLTRRYHIASVSLLSRVWLRYLAFTIGTMLVLIGATFILGKLREDTTEVKLANSLSSLNLNSASPGIILAILGVFLMTTAALIPQSVDVTDGAIYLTTSNVGNPAMLGESTGGGGTQTPLEFDNPNDATGDNAGGE